MKKQIQKNSIKTSTSTDKEIIKVENLNVIYFKNKPNQVQALTDINLKIYPGEFVVFFGPSGCGKSTLLYAIAGLERNIEGNVLVNGKNLTKFSDEDFDDHRRYTAGMIFQAYHLINSLNVLSNIILPQFATDTPPKERETKALELLKFFGVLEQKKKFPNELSGGQQQRVAICRSLMNDPKMILADEPTGNLDSKSAVDVMNTLLDLNETQKKTIILVTHSPASLDYAHRVFYIKDGKIVDQKVNRPVGSKINKSALPADILEADLEAGYKPGEKPVKAGEDDKTEFMSKIKAKEIIFDALLNINSKSYDKLESLVAGLILKGKKGKNNLKKLISRNKDLSGFDLDKKKAKKLTQKIEQLINESRPSARVKDKISEDIEQVLRIRNSLVSEFKIRLSDQQELQFDDLLASRWLRDIDAEEVYQEFIRRKKGGLAIAPKLARKIVKKLELLIIEKL